MRIRDRVLALSLVLVAGCSDGEIEVLEGAGPRGAAQPVIYGGSAPDASFHDAVVALHQLTRDGASVYVSPFCTGTLISPTVVLTAAHCLDTSKGGSSFATMAPTALAIYVGDDPSTDLVAHLYDVTETQIHPSYDRVRLRNDIALVRLSRAVTEPVGPVAPLPASLGFTSADVGKTMNFAGFGETESGSSGVKLQVDVPLGSLGCKVSGCPDAGDAATQIAYAQGDGGPCFGDSGGPMFLTRGGAAYVGGITSYGDSYCTRYGVSTRVDAYGDFIAAFAGDSGGGGIDTGTGGGGTCGDGTCDVGESCDGRYATESCPSDCDGVSKGKPTARYCYVDGACEGAGCP